MSSSQTSSGQGSPSSSSSLQIRLTRVEETSSPAPSSVAALQIPVQIPLQITHLGERNKDADAAAAQAWGRSEWLKSIFLNICLSVRLLSGRQRQWNHHSELRSPADLWDPACKAPPRKWCQDVHETLSFNHISVPIFGWCPAATP